jgi:hypothetical protein
MDQKLLLDTKQSIHLEELRKALQENGNVQADFPTTYYATCGGTCFIACDGTCWPGCQNVCTACRGCAGCVGSCAGFLNN